MCSGWPSGDYCYERIYYVSRAPVLSSYSPDTKRLIQGSSLGCAPENSIWPLCVLPEPKLTDPPPTQTRPSLRRSSAARRSVRAVESPCTPLRKWWALGRWGDQTGTVRSSSVFLSSCTYKYHQCIVTATVSNHRHSNTSFQVFRELNMFLDQRFSNTGPGIYYNNKNVYSPLESHEL